MVVALTEIESSQLSATDPTLYGVWLVITPTDTLESGDMVRVLWREPPHAYGYLMRRGGSRAELPRRDMADKLAARMEICMEMPLSHLFAMDVPRALPARDPHHEMESFLVRAPHLVPDGGWVTFLRDAGVGVRFTPPRSWQFYGKCWDDSVTTGKTGGLHLSIVDTTRRCQLSVEYGVCGDSLMGLPNMKAGLLMYITSERNALSLTF